MKRAYRTWSKSGERRGILTFEWILLITLLVIGIIGAAALVRNALICELTDLAGCISRIHFCDDDDDCPDWGEHPWWPPGQNPWGPPGHNPWGPPGQNPWGPPGQNPWWHPDPSPHTP